MNDCKIDVTSFECFTDLLKSGLTNEHFMYSMYPRGEE